MGRRRSEADRRAVQCWGRRRCILGLLLPEQHKAFTQLYDPTVTHSRLSEALSEPDRKGMWEAGAGSTGDALRADRRQSTEEVVHSVRIKLEIGSGVG